MFGIYRNKIIVFFILISNAVMAQRGEIYSPDFDNKAIHFGFAIGIIRTHYAIDYINGFNNYNNSTFPNPDGIYSIVSPGTYALNAMGTINFHLSNRFDFRISPLSIAIYRRKIVLNNDFVTPSSTITQSDKAYFEIPMIFKYKSDRRNNSRAYLFGGFKLGFETNVLKRNRDNFPTRAADIGIEYGMGLEFFREYFNICPELHFTHGFINQVDQVNSKSNYFLKYVDKMQNHSVSLIIAFQ